jgi:hypothetical protein
MKNADLYSNAAGYRVAWVLISTEYGPEFFPALTTRVGTRLFIQIMPVFGNCTSSLSLLVAGSPQLRGLVI